MANDNSCDTSPVPEGPEDKPSDDMPGAGPPTAAAGILIYRVLEEIQYLLLQASYRGFHWSPPKGHVDPGEDKLTTAIRETEEEAGISRNQYELDTLYPPTVLQYEVDNKPKTVDYFLAKLSNPLTPIKLSEEHKDFKWVNVDEALSITYADIGEAILKADKYIREKVEKEDTME